MTKHTILFLAADPNGTDPRTLDREARAIQVELERSGFRDHFKLETRWAAEPLDLLRELRKLRPTVVHFAGRGTADAALRFLGPDGRVQLVSVQALEETFGAGGSSVQLVILSACYSDVQARALLPHVGCVVGVSGALHDTAARSFAIGFYGGLGERESVAAAFKQGCAAIRLEGLGDRHLPQLMVRAGVDAATLILGSPDAAATPVNSFTAPPPAPAYPDAATRTRSEWLEDARLRRRMLRDAGQPTDETDREILEVRRQLREGGQLRAGDSLDDGRYLLVQEVGRGGFAVVWDAYDRTEQQHVAIKVLHTNLAGDPLRRERFFRGARAMRDLAHPAVVRVLEPQSEDGGFHYFVMELLTGGNLRQAVLANRVANERALPLLLHVIEAVASAHARAMVHRDIKPANILLDGEGNPKLTDFDLVGGADTTGGTRTGAMGTFIYAAPECLDKPQEATARADVYGLGMTALFCLSGQELSLSVFRNPELLIARLACSDRVRDVLRRAVAWEPGDRFADADALGHTLREALASRHRELEGADLLTSPGPGPVAGGAEPVSSPVAEPPYLEVEITFDGEHLWLPSGEGPPDREVGIEPHDGPGSGAVNPDTWPTEKTRVWKPALSPAKQRRADDDGQPPLPKPMPFHSDADEFPPGEEFTPGLPSPSEPGDPGAVRPRLLNHQSLSRAEAPPVRASAPSRAPLAILIVALLAAAGGAVWFFVLRDKGSDGTTTGSGGQVASGSAVAGSGSSMVAAGSDSAALLAGSGSSMVATGSGSAKVEAPKAPIEETVIEEPDARPPVADAAPPPCIGGDVREVDKDTGACYMFFTSPMTRDAARRVCGGLGSHLAFIKSASARAIIIRLIGMKEAFLGASDEVTEKSFVWDDGSPFQLTNWNAGEPNDADANEDCVEIIGSLGGVLNDVPCAPTPTNRLGKYPFVCQRD